MDKMVIQGGAKLSGTVSASGSKNSALPLMFATLLAEGEHILHNVPHLNDIQSSSRLLEELGCKVARDGHTLRISVPLKNSTLAHYDHVRKMRASILCLGPLLARFGEAKVSLPGGCAIGTRPINFHLEALKSMGAEIEVKEGYVYGNTNKLKGSSVLFDSPSVGGTENIMMAATLADGKTVIENAAKEPEIVDLANYLNKMGAKVSGAGSSIVSIEGVDKLNSAEHDVIPDRIEAGTLLLAGAITGSEVTVDKCVPSHLEALIEKMREAGFTLKTGEDSITVLACDSWRGIDVTTAPHPGFPTDLQAQFMAVMTQAEGTSVITESVFENRFMHVQELVRLDADITPKSRVSIVRGKKGGLLGAQVMATDLRASACLVLSGLVAKGETTVGRIYHLDRGYEKLESKLAQLGAKIQRVSE